MSNNLSDLPLQVLLVDDDVDFLAYLLSAAEPFNLLIHTCDTVQTARSKISASLYNAYIIDLNLPDGSGLDLIKEIRKKNQQASIVVISGDYHTEENCQTFKDKYGIDYILDKPIYPKQIENLLSNFCLHSIHPAEPMQDNKLQTLKHAYDKTIVDKIDLLTKLVKNVQSHPNLDSLKSLKETVHKIGGSAGSYGYPHVSAICEELDYDLKKKIDSNAPIEQEWLADLSHFLNHVKFHYQVTPSHVEPSFPVHNRIGARSSLFVIDNDASFLELLEQQKRLFPIDLEYESNPEKAIERLHSAYFNPRLILVAQTFTGSSITGYDIIDKVRQKVNFLPTIFGILLSPSDNIDQRIEAAEKGVKYIFQKPISAYVLLKTMAHIVEKDYQRNFKVLVLDDDSDVCQFISIAMNEVGVDVRVLHDPTQLYPVLEEYMPQVLLLDIFLPKYDGFNLLKTLRADLTYQNLIIVIITIRNEPNMEKTAYLNNADDIFYKPLDKTMLQQRILNLLRRHVLSGHLGYNKEWIGLDRLEVLISKLQEILLKPRYTDQYLALFDMDHFSDLILQKGQAKANEILISISNLIRKEANHTISPFFYKSSEFALIFEGLDSRTVEERMHHLLLKIKNESKSDISLSCGIVPISKQLGDAHEVLQSAEKALAKARQREPTAIKIELYLPEGETISKKEVVLIDPDHDLLNLLKLTFESHGFNVKTFKSGEEALKTLLSYNESRIPALIISERKLPDMDGLEVLSKLKLRFHQPLPFYFLTVYASDKDINEGLGYGALDYITKPFNLSIFVKKALNTTFKSSRNLE